MKRRRSPGEETTAKLRRLSISSGSSPSLRRGRKVIKPDKNQPLITQVLWDLKTAELRPDTLFKKGKN